MMKKTFILIFSLLSFISNSQINDDFESGTIGSWTENYSGRWDASTISPVNGLYSLHHIFDNITGDHDQISTAFGSYDISLETTTWRFKIKHTYTPSSSNNWACFLFSDKDAEHMHPDSSFNGYIIGVNFTGLDDIIKLWKVSGSEKKEVINTGVNWETEVGTLATAAFEIKRTTNGDWSVFLSNTGSFNNLSQIGSSSTDAEHITTSYFGFHYEYSSAQDMKLWFDDVYVGSEILDTISPVITTSKAVSYNTLIVNFNEAVSEASAENIGNFSIDGGIGNPISASRSQSNYKETELIFVQTFIDQQNYELTVNNVEDLSGNSMSDERTLFNYTHISPVKVIAISSTQINISFNKEVEITGPENYTVNNDIGNPFSVTIDAYDHKIIHLNFSNSLNPDQVYTISMQDIQDVYGNIIYNANVDFTYHIVKPFDIVINEIMCDINPLPNPYLPPAKYIEIYNTSDFDINLSNWTLKVGDNSEKIFPAYVIPSYRYAILCDDDDESMFLSFGKTLPIFNSSELTTTGKRIVIRNENSSIIEDLTYSKEWYDDTKKDDGGWSLERIDPDNFCGEDDNWTAYNNNQLNYGGTPGSINSVDDENIDEAYPELTDLKIIASNYIILKFNKIISYESGSSIENFDVNYGIGNPTESYSNSMAGEEVHLKFAGQFQDNQDYTLTVGEVEDNCKNESPLFSVDFTYFKIRPENIIVLDDKNLKILFSETVDLTTGTNENNYSCDNNIGNPSLAIRESSDTTIIYLEFENSFPDGINCSLNISNIKDINGNSMFSTQIPFTFYLPKENDLVINEILFNPYPGGQDFVEIYNNSEYDIDILDIQISGKEKLYPYNIISISELSDESLILKAKDYMAFTTSKHAIQYFYMSYNEQNIIEVESLPAFNDDSGKIVLLHKRNSILDEFAYNDDMHLQLIKDTEGVSLERVHPDRLTHDPANWHSASEMVGFSTPAYKNSQYYENAEFENDPILIDPYIFSPDNDGLDDYANICYNFNSPGFVATIYIFDSEGRIVKQLANNITLATEGAFVWDGLYSDHRIAPAGTYVVWFRVNDLNGYVKVYKKAVVLAKRY